MTKEIKITAKQFLDYLKKRILSKVNFGKELTLSDIEIRFGQDDICIDGKGRIKNCWEKYFTKKEN